MFRKHLRTKLRIFQEKTKYAKSYGEPKVKGQRLLKLHQFYSAKNTRRDTHQTRNPFFPNWKQKKHLSRHKTFPKNLYFRKNSAENPDEPFMLATFRF